MELGLKRDLSCPQVVRAKHRDREDRGDPGTEYCTEDQRLRSESQWAHHASEQFQVQSSSA